ncbi:hypothetical protein PLICRDRAFT_41973 [Plicaturopsis crispa FD-325 SS-3]|nr:hypothetical protein PLICRDRAFT_41973 [Plicaturopsis crispa FD-325 SS-3]
MAAVEVSEPPLYDETPFIQSSHISAVLNASAYLKLEGFHRSQSFKYRGISRFAQQCKAKYGPDVHLVIGSGGNAGLAAACAANLLGVRCTVYITEGVSQRTLDFFKQEKAEVILAGKYYQHTADAAAKAAELDEKTIVVPAFDHPVLREGHGSMITEIKARLPHKPDAIFCSVGGGGLLGGVLVGCKANDWDDVPVIAMETHGANCFHYSIAINQGKFGGGENLPEGIDFVYKPEHGVKLARFENITSRATSLGASWPAPAVVKLALERAGGIKCVSVPDEMSMQSTLLFSEGHKMLVELACSTTLTPGYNPELFSKIVPPREDQKPLTVVFIVCGGFKICLEEMQEYRAIVRRTLEEKPDELWEVWGHDVDDPWKVPKINHPHE